jgi:glycerol kinase
VSRYVLALDQGTTSSRAIVFDRDTRIVGLGQREFPQIYPQPGEVEHNPDDIWSSQLTAAREAMNAAGATAADIAAIGITNQRETTLLWERDTGRTIGNAIVWQSRVSAPVCERLKADGLEPLFRERTGLLLDPYFSGTKITHLLGRDPQLRARAERGEILFGTVDSFLIWQLTGGRVHVTDASNASRTLLLNLRTLDWDDDLLRALDIPRAMMPRVVATSGQLGTSASAIFGGEIPIASAVGDQQAALFGQSCFRGAMAARRNRMHSRLERSRAVGTIRARRRRRLLRSGVRRAGRAVLGAACAGNDCRTDARFHARAPGPRGP